MIRRLIITGFWLIMAVAPLTAEPPQVLQTSNLSPEELKHIGIEQRLGQTIPPNLTFKDSSGQKTDLSALVGGKPTLLVLVYYNCPNLCTLVLNATVASVADLRHTVGDGFQIVVISIDPTETPALAAQKKATYLLRYSRGQNQESEWSFLVGEEPNIRKLADAVGYHYRYDPTIH